MVSPGGWLLGTELISLMTLEKCGFRLTGPNRAIEDGNSYHFCSEATLLAKENVDTL